MTSYTYDARGRRTGTTLPDPDGTGPLVAPTLSWSFDDANRLSSETDARGSVTSYSYDNLGRLVERTLPDPDGSGPLASPFESFTHNAAGQMTIATDPLSNVTNYTYDNLGRLTQVELPDPDASGPLSRPTTTYAYDALGRRTSLTDPESNVTSWSYDNLGRLVSEIDPLSEVTSYAYDAAGRLTERTDRRGLVTEFNYDDLDRMTSEVWKDGSSTVRTLSFSHDAVGNLLSASDPSASYDYTYDNLYRTTQTEVDYGTGVNSFRLTAAFDAASRRTSLGLEVDSGSGWGDDLLNSYSFDSLGRVTQITQAGQTGGATVQNKRVDFAYTVDGLFDSITRYKSLTGGSANEVARSEYTRDDLGRITSLEHLHDTTSIADYNFIFDAYSRITQVAATSLVGLAGTTDFTYDTTGQLTAADHTHISDEAYSYDENGNRTNKVRISTAPADDKTVETQWDHRNRLISIVTKNNSGVVTKEVDYEYDVFNRRVSKSIDADGAGPASAEVTRFVYDGGDILAVTDASGDITDFSRWDFVSCKGCQMHLDSSHWLGSLDQTGSVLPLSCNLLLRNSASLEYHESSESHQQSDLIDGDLIGISSGLIPIQRQTEEDENAADDGLLWISKEDATDEPRVCDQVNDGDPWIARGAERARMIRLGSPQHQHRCNR